MLSLMGGEASAGHHCASAAEFEWSIRGFLSDSTWKPQHGERVAGSRTGYNRPSRLICK